MSESPVVVIPAPIDIMDWNYDVEREILEKQGIRLVVPASAEEARAAMADADVIFTSSPLTADDIASLRNCVGILCYSVGMDYVDAAAAKARGIPIWNCPTSNNEEVSDHAVLLILAAQRRLLPLAIAAREGDWDIYQWPLLGEIHRLSTRTVGIIGLGRIGHLVARKLHGFRLTVIANDPFIDGTADPEVELVSLDELCAAGGHRRVLRRPDRLVARPDRRRDDRQDEARRHRRERVARRRRRRGRAGRRARVGSRRLRRPRRPQPRAAAARQRPDHAPAERRPDPAHRGKLGGVDRRAARRGGQPDHRDARPGRPAPEQPEPERRAGGRYGPLPEHRDGQRRLSVGRRRAARRSHLPAGDPPRHRRRASATSTCSGPPARDTRSTPRDSGR